MNLQMLQPVLLVYVRYISDGDFKDEVSILQTTARNVFDTVGSFLKEQKRRSLGKRFVVFAQMVDLC